MLYNELMELMIKGYSILLDEEDYQKVNEVNWSPSFRGRKDPNKRYFVGNVKLSGRKQEFLHRFILNAPSYLMVDHINGDILDNRKSNLRFATRSQNHANTPKYKSNKSGYKGVWLQREKRKGKKAKDRWMATATYQGRTIHLGSFKIPSEAAKAYDQFILEKFGEFARTNF